jgi:hypothetical protein
MAIAGRHGGEGLSRQLLMTAAAGVALPLLLFFYYRRDDVRAACEELDPTVRWTDRTPLPVLGVVIVLAFSAAALLSNLAVPSFQVLGRQVTGAPAALTMFALAVLCAVLALESYKLNESAWWTLILLQVIGLAWAVTSFVMAGGGGDPLFTALVAATWIAYFGFLLSIRRYFVRPLVPRTRREDQSSVAA